MDVRSYGLIGQGTAIVKFDDDMQLLFKGGVREDGSIDRLEALCFYDYGSLAGLVLTERPLFWSSGWLSQEGAVEYWDEAHALTRIPYRTGMVEKSWRWWNFSHLVHEGIVLRESLRRGEVTQPQEYSWAYRQEVPLDLLSIAVREERV